MKKIPLTIVSDSFLPRRDGVVRFLSEIIPRLQKTFSITVISPDYKEDNVSLPGVSTVRIPRTKRYVGDYRIAKFRPFTIFGALLKSEVVFVQDIAPIGITGLFLAQRMRKKTIAFIHVIDWEIFPKALGKSIFKKYAYPLSKRVARFLYSRCDELIVPSERIADILTWEGIQTPKTVVHLGVDTKRFIPLDDEHERIEKRKKLGIEIDDVVIGYHGRVSREKDVLTLARAFVKLRKKYGYLKLLIVGNGIPSIIKQIRKQEGVIYLPATDQVEDYLPLMDVYCLPSLVETTSLGTLEAMSAKLPVVCTRVGFLKDYVVPEVNGLFFKQKDSFSLAKQLEKLILNKHFRSILGNNARNMVVKDFDWDKTATKLVDFFKGLTHVR